MKLFVIVLCLLSERYLVHALSFHRFTWFTSYVNYLNKKLANQPWLFNNYLLPIIVIVPVLLIVWVLLSIAGHALAGLLCLVINLLIFYYCLGPDNSFYPKATVSDELEGEIIAGNYFADVNSQLFAVIFWYLLFGPLGALLYRLISLCKGYPNLNLAEQLLSLADWVTVRITLLFYLLAGNFQHGFSYYRQLFFSSPINNTMLLSTGGLLAARMQDDQAATLITAQKLVEYALIIYLMVIALFTLAAWLG